MKPLGNENRIDAQEVNSYINPVPDLKKLDFDTSPGDDVTQEVPQVNYNFLLATVTNIN